MPDTTLAPRRFHWPADYYSAPASEAVLPRWAVHGCGGASALILLLVFAGGAFLASGGFVDLMDLVLGMSVGEMKGMYAANVPAVAKSSLESEVERLRTDLREGRLPVAALQPFLETMRDVTHDSKVTTEEAERLRKSAASVKPPARH